MHASVDCERKLVVNWVASADLEETREKEVWLIFSPQPSALVSWLSYSLFCETGGLQTLIAIFSFLFFVRRLKFTKRHGIY